MMEKGLTLEQMALWRLQFGKYRVCHFGAKKQVIHLVVQLLYMDTRTGPHLFRIQMCSVPLPQVYKAILTAFMTFVQE